MAAYEARPYGFHQYNYLTRCLWGPGENIPIFSNSIESLEKNTFLIFSNLNHFPSRFVWTPTSCDVCQLTVSRLSFRILLQYKWYKYPPHSNVLLSRSQKLWPKVTWPGRAEPVSAVISGGDALWHARRRPQLNTNSGSTLQYPKVDSTPPEGQL